MSSPVSDFALLLAAPQLAEMELARELLASAGIPSLVHGQDRDFAELGAYGQIAIARPDLYVPKNAIERARSLLKETWDASALTDELAESEPVEETQRVTSSSFARKFLWYALVTAVAFAAAWTFSRYFRSPDA